MNQDLRRLKPVFMPGQKKGRRFMESGKGKEEQEKIRKQEEGKEKRI